MFTFFCLFAHCGVQHILLVFGLRHVASFTGLSIFDCSFDILFTFIILTMIYLKTLFTVKQQLARYMTSDVNVMNLLQIKIIEKNTIKLLHHSCYKILDIQFLSYLTFQCFDFLRSWWRLFQKHVVRLKFDITFYFSAHDTYM